MTLRHRVIWSQGMFLQPHHFQQESRFFENLVDARLRAAEPYAWGFGQLMLDEAQLALGSLALSRASGVMTDGTPFSMPDADALPSEYAVPSDVQGEIIYLAAPQSRIGVNEVDFGDGQGDAMARYAVNDQDLRDHTNAADDPEAVQTGAVRFRLLRQRDLTDAYSAIGVARVIERRADGQIVLDRGYIAPQTRIEGSGQLSTTATLLHGLVQQRARTLASQMGQLGHGTSEVADFLSLLVLNRAEPLMRQFAAAPSVHPWPVYLAWLQLAGELSTFSTTQRHPPEYPVYKHDDLQRVFAPVIRDLRDLLSAVIERHAVQIELTQRANNVSTAVVGDMDLLRTAGFILAVRADMPVEQVRQRFPAQSKLGPADRLKDLVNLQLPGIVMRSLPTAPPQLPFHTGSHYFELDRHGDLWKQLERSGRMALHVGGDFPGLELELWAIRAS